MDVKRVKVHVWREELESVDEISLEHKLLPCLLCLEMLATLGGRHGLVHKERRVLLHMWAPISKRHSRIVMSLLGCHDCGLRAIVAATGPVRRG